MIELADMQKLKKIKYLLNTLPRLGGANVFYMFYYRLAMKLNLKKNQFPIQKIAFKQEIFSPIENNYNFQEIENCKNLILEKAEKIYQGQFEYFHFHQFQLSPIPNWFYDPFSKKTLADSAQQKHWTTINEFDLNTGDIKNLWEISRWDWLTTLAQGYALTNDSKFLDRLNALLKDWNEKNPVNIGVNWRCGQETSIRVMRLFYSALILNQLDEIKEELYNWILAHLDRICHNIQYAIAQDNNHGTSEAAALYIGALWLLNLKSVVPTHKKRLIFYKNKGRAILVNRIQKLILSDGTFAQKSVNYHRVVVDTFSFVLNGMKIWNEEEFKGEVQKKLVKLGLWQLEMISNEKGEVPNLGANDGALFDSLHHFDYRDYRPALQTYFALLNGQKVWNEPSLNASLFWRKINIEQLKPFKFKASDNIVLDKEFVKMSFKDTQIRLIATQNNFRPENSPLHIDVWHQGENILMDAGSFSYNAANSSYFKSIEAHNTLQFGKEQAMPQISRFLNGCWIEVEGCEIKDKDEYLVWKGQYKDYRGNKHTRKVKLYKKTSEIHIIDEFESAQEETISLRFHLIETFQEKLTIESFDEKGEKLVPLHSEGMDSLYYNQQSSHHLITFAQNIHKGSFHSIIHFKA